MPPPRASIEKLYSHLNDEHISEEEYEHAKTVWKEFEICRMRDYHDLYIYFPTYFYWRMCSKTLETHVLRTIIKLDPAWYYTSPGLTWDAALKITGSRVYNGKQQWNAAVFSTAILLGTIFLGLVGKNKAILGKYSFTQNECLIDRNFPCRKPK